MKPQIQSQLDRLPGILQDLRQGSAGRTLRAAVVQIEQRTGVKLDPSRISRWERGLAKPSFELLVIFLEGLGYSLTTLQQELARAAREVSDETPPQSAEEAEASVADPVTELAERLFVTEARLEELEEKIETLESEI